MADVGDIGTDMRGKCSPGRKEIAVRAARQHGVIARWQLLEMGFRAGSIDRFIAAGYLHPLYRAVFAVGHTNVSQAGRVLAAVLAYGPHALASHVAGAWVWDLLRWPGSTIDVSVPGRAARPRDGIRVHRPRSLGPEDRAMRGGIPCTSVARVLLDIADTRPRLLRRAFEEAERTRVLDMRRVHGLLERSKGHRGAPALSSLIAEVTDPPPRTRSDLEEAFRAFLREEGIRQPDAMNAMIGEFEVDAVWFDEQVVAEIDHYSTHGHRSAFERDRVRDAELQLLEFRPIRVTDRMMEERTALSGRLRRMLSAGRRGARSAA